MTLDEGAVITLSLLCVLGAFAWLGAIVAATMYHWF